MKLRITLVPLLLLLWMSTSALLACPMCFNADQGNTIKATNNAVVILLGITGFVLLTFAAFFIYLWKRSRKIREHISDDSFVDEEGTIHWKQNKGTFEWKNS